MQILGVMPNIARKHRTCDQCVDTSLKVDCPQKRVYEQQIISVQDKRLVVQHLPDVGMGKNKRAGFDSSRCYTLTHNDITGNLLLSVGSHFNWNQVSGVWSQIVRDEILAWWEIPPKSLPYLHVQCHVSGEQKWPLPPCIRYAIFIMELPLVLHCISNGDLNYLTSQKNLQNGRIKIHLQSDVQKFNRDIEWGEFAKPNTWISSKPPLYQFLCYLQNFGFVKTFLVWLASLQGSNLEFCSLEQNWCENDIFV
eukprot:TRINITY_DN2307_c1_g1_i8.p1 TRINITY_DN2307_c1_g1~~TRINITY_DN2307_c1_g1_i8.p1  ORF type:complete len:252 (-),score=11.95 TRINITY_DN2307_c1_g1_i8:137-892(-)